MKAEFLAAVSALLITGGIYNLLVTRDRIKIVLSVLLFFNGLELLAITFSGFTSMSSYGLFVPISIFILGVFALTILISVIRFESRKRGGKSHIQEHDG